VVDGGFVYAILTSCPGVHVSAYDMSSTTEQWTWTISTEGYLDFGQFYTDLGFIVVGQPAEYKYTLNIYSTKGSSLWSYSSDPPEYPTYFNYGAGLLAGEPVFYYTPFDKTEIYAHKAMTGEQLWKVVINTTVFLFPDVILPDKVIYQIPFGHLYCLSATTGSLLWKVELPNIYAVCVQLYEGKLYINAGQSEEDGNGWLGIVNIDTGGIIGEVVPATWDGYWSVKDFVVASDVVMVHTCSNGYNLGEIQVFKDA